MSKTQRISARYVMYVLLSLLTAACVITATVVLYHWKFEHGYGIPAVNPIGLYSQREGPIYWVLFVLTIVRLVMLMEVVARCVNSNNAFFRYLLIPLMILLIAAEVAGCVIFFEEQKGCNNAPTDDPSGSFNLCNDYRWCLVYGNYGSSFDGSSIVEPSCPLVIGTPLPPTTEDDLSGNWVFYFFLGSTFVFMFLGLVHILMSEWMGYGYANSEAFENDYIGTDVDFMIESKFTEDPKTKIKLNTTKRFEADPKSK
jgi:hypothetical protein